MTISTNQSSEKKIKTLDNNSIDKSYIVDQLILMVENIDDIKVRCNCLEALDHIDYKSDKLFSNLENILISDSEDEIRKKAAKIIGRKFITRGVDPLGFAILHEKKYDNLLNVLVILEKLKVDEIHQILLEKLNNFEDISSEQFKELPSSHLIQILINQLTLSCLKSKYSHLEYKVEKGYITELDFSKVNNKILDWRYREKIQDHTEIHGIKHLEKLTKVVPFSSKWTIRNRFTMQCQVELIKALGNSNKISIKNSLISQIKNINECTYRKSINQLIENIDSFSNLSTRKLMDILLNYIVIQFLRTKAPNLHFELKEGLVCTLSIENVKLIKIPKCVELLSSLISLRFNKCNIYEIPKFIGNLKNLINLELADNKISSVPESIAGLKLLKHLDLKNNRIYSI